MKKTLVFGMIGVVLLAGAVVSAGEASFVVVGAQGDVSGRIDPEGIEFADSGVLDGVFPMMANWDFFPSCGGVGGGLAQATYLMAGPESLTLAAGASYMLIVPETCTQDHTVTAEGITSMELGFDPQSGYVEIFGRISSFSSTDGPMPVTDSEGKLLDGILEIVDLTTGEPVEVVGDVAGDTYEWLVELDVSHMYSVQVSAMVEGGPSPLMLSVDIQNTVEMLIVGYDPGALVADVDITPDTLNLKSRGRFISAFITLPEGYSIDNINTSAVMLSDGETEVAGRYCESEDGVIVAKFPRKDVEDMLDVGEVELMVSGELLDGTAFSGSDTINVIDPGAKNKKTKTVKARVNQRSTKQNGKDDSKGGKK